MITIKPFNYLVVDTTAFIQNAPLQDFAENIITCPEVVNEVTNKRQLRRLVVLPYNLDVKEVFPENVKIVTDFTKKTGDYPSLSATDIKVMALTYQLEKEKVGTDHLRTEPIVQKPIVTTTNYIPHEMLPDMVGFVVPEDEVLDTVTNSELDKKLLNQLESLECTDEQDFSAINSKPVDGETKDFQSDEQDLLEKEADNCDILIPVYENNNDSLSNSADEEDDDDGWITPSNIQIAKKQLNSKLTEDDHATVACMTTDFAMQNVLRQMNLNVSALNGRIIKQVRTYIFRCYTCFKTTSIMTKRFCPKCGNNTLKKVAASLDENGKLQIHINTKRPLSTRGKKCSLPKIKGGKHPNNPILVEDQPMPHNRPSRLAKTKNNPLDDDYIAGYSPFIMRDINSRSAQLCIRPGQELKNRLSNGNQFHRKKR